MSKYVHKVQSFPASVHNSVLFAVSLHFHISDLSIIHCIKEHLHVEQCRVEIKQGKLIRSRHCINERRSLTRQIFLQGSESSEMSGGNENEMHTRI